MKDVRGGGGGVRGPPNLYRGGEGRTSNIMICYCLPPDPPLNARTRAYTPTWAMTHCAHARVRAHLRAHGHTAAIERSIRKAMSGLGRQKQAEPRNLVKSCITKCQIGAIRCKCVTKM